MGMFRVRVRVANGEGEKRSFEDDFWVDTGALYSFVPGERLRAIGLVPHGERRLVFADGRQETRPIGTAVFGIEGIAERIPCPVIFAPPGSQLLLGATALENFGLDADPAQKCLKPVLSLIGGFLGSR